eukprot:CAMPEP_0171606260 /NCGR_PEP_ID=MMETSP0990-20121206/7662_1 /TAXON_ID=483369 /ORGANISM="non described non described, Strain CCMP2098" /LENGTH=64 /DNA_ID=CAMNT_0012169073 /DNA_START=260 /DNA_END=451 /DNA_ORIENTATION=+
MASPSAFLASEGTTPRYSALTPPCRTRLLMHATKAATCPPVEEEKEEDAAEGEGNEEEEEEEEE